MGNRAALFRRNKDDEEAEITKLKKNVVDFCGEDIEFDSKGNSYTTDEVTVSSQDIQKCAIAMDEANALIYDKIDKDGTMKKIEERASEASNDLDTCRKREHLPIIDTLFDMANYRIDRICDKQYSELYRQHKDTLESLLGEIDKEYESVFYDIMQKRAAALVPKKTLGSDEKGWPSYFRPRSGRWFIRDVPDFVKGRGWLSWLNYFGWV